MHPLGSNNPNIEHPASVDRPMFSPEWPVTSPNGYRITDNMIYEPYPEQKSFRIVMMGAGASGIDFLHHAIQAFKKDDPDVEFVAYEKNHDIGGTWLENRYPGCACDIPSASYQFPWRPNPDWTRYYSTSQEIWKYLKDIVDEEGMMQYIKLRTSVTHAAWQEEKSKWLLHLVERNDKDEVVRQWDEECNVFLNGGGVLK